MTGQGTAVTQWGRSTSDFQAECPHECPQRRLLEEQERARGGPGASNCTFPPGSTDRLKPTFALLVASKPPYVQGDGYRRIYAFHEVFKIPDTKKVRLDSEITCLKKFQHSICQWKKVIVVRFLKHNFNRRTLLYGYKIGLIFSIIYLFLQSITQSGTWVVQ